MKLGRLVSVALVALALSAPATAAVSDDGGYGDVLVLAKEQLAKVTALG